MALIFPAALIAADSSATAMLYAHGTTLLNGSNVARSSALFNGDFVQTKAESAASMNAIGSTVLILNNTRIQYEGGAVKLEHGTVAVSTSNLLAARVGDITVSPMAGVWTEFEVGASDGTIQIAARKGDLTISDGNGTTTLAQGQETTRDQPGAQQPPESEKKRRGAAPPATGAILDSDLAKWIATGVVAAVTAWVLWQGDDPLSGSQ
jgi:hypothetical protein